MKGTILCLLDKKPEVENPEKAKELEALKDSKAEEFKKAVKTAVDELFEKQKKERNSASSSISNWETWSLNRTCGGKQPPRIRRPFEERFFLPISKIRVSYP